MCVCVSVCVGGSGEVNLWRFWFSFLVIGMRERAACGVFLMSGIGNYDKFFEVNKIVYYMCIYKYLVCRRKIYSAILCCRIYFHTHRIQVIQLFIQQHFHNFT